MEYCADTLIDTKRKKENSSFFKIADNLKIGHKKRDQNNIDPFYIVKITFDYIVFKNN